MTVRALLNRLTQAQVQIWVQEGQLKFNAPKGVMQGALRDAVIEQKPDLIAHLTAPIITRASPLQEALWVECAVAAEGDGRGDLYTEAACFALSGSLEIAAFEAAVADLGRKHAALSTWFAMTDDGLMQVIDPQEEVVVTQLTLQGADEHALREKAAELAYRPFDLTGGQLSRIALLTGADDQQILVLSQHHLITDRWSIGVLFKDLSQFYADRLVGNQQSHRPPQSTYADYAAQMQDARGEMAHLQALGQLVDQLAQMPVELDLPYDRGPQRGFDLAGGQMSVACPADLFGQINRVCADHGVTSFAYLATALGMVLGRYAATRDLVVVIPNSARPEAAYEDVAGLFVNALPLAMSFDPDATVAQTLRRVQDQALDVMAADTLTLADVLAGMDVSRDGAAPPLCQAMLVVQNMEMHDLSLADVALRDLKIRPRSAKMPLSLTVLPTLGGVTFVWDYQTALFDTETIERMSANFMTVLEAAVTPDCTLAALPYLAVEEAARIKAAGQPKPQPYPRERTIPQVFADVALRHRQNVALESGDETLTYAALAERARRYAAYLVDQGIEPGDRVGLSLLRGFDLYVATLGILQAGAAYVPLDASYPSARLQAMVEQSKLAGVISAALPDWISGPRLLPPAQVPDDQQGTTSITLPDVAPDAPAYLMFTSGTTGKPKAVVTPHRGVLRLVTGSDFLRFDTSLSMVQMAPFAFDAATLELWGPLLNGGRVVIAPEGALSPRQIAQLITDTRVSALWLPAGLLAVMVASELNALCQLETLIAGGDTLAPEAVASALAAFTTTQLINGYGPTENTTFTTTHRFDDSGDVLIGRPVGSTTCLILDKAGQPVPIGARGMLWTGGDGLALEYFDDPAATEAAFVVRNGQRLYNTGDLARWVSSADGTLAIALMGRADSQVKVAGHRITLAEVESHLTASADVQRAMVLCPPADATETRLFAFVQLHRGTVDDVRAAMAAVVPPYMMPQVFVSVADWPLTPNGKVDRGALLALARESAAPVSEHAELRDDTDRQVAEIWADVLSRPVTSCDVHFFQAGGHSLLAMQMVHVVQTILGVQVALRQVFDHPTLGAFCDSLSQGGEAQHALFPQAASAQWPLSMAQQRLWSLHQMMPLGASYHVPGLFRIKGPLDRARLQSAMTRIVARHPALRACFVSTQTGAYQQIEPAEPVDLAAQKVTADQLDFRVHQFITEDMAITEGEVFRTALFEIAPQDHMLCVMAHHLVCDGLSVNVLMADLAALYDAPDAALPALPISYGDYAIWQNEQAFPARRATLEHYWQDRLATLPDLNLFTDRSRPEMMDLSGAAVTLALPDHLRDLCKRLDVTLHSFITAAFSVLLSRLSGQDDFALGTPVAGRSDPQLAGIAGFLNETLVLRTTLDPSEPFTTYLDRLRGQIIADMAHQDMPFAALVDLLNPPRKLNRTPLFQAMVAVNEGLDPDLTLGGLDVSRVMYETQTAKYELNLDVSVTDAGLVAQLAYQTSLFDPSSAQQIADQFAALVESLCLDPSQIIGQLGFEVAATPVALSVMKGHKVDHWQAGGLLAIAQRQDPDRLATLDTGDGAAATYGQMMKRVAGLAAALHAVDVQQGAFVAVHVGRHSDGLVALLAILWVGAVYVPIRPSLPHGRKQGLLAQLDHPVVISHGAVENMTAQDWIDPRTLPHDFDAPLPYDPAPDHPAYMLFTSGSTGTPKGAIVPHRALMNHAEWFTSAFEVTEQDRFLQVSEPDFDISVHDMTTALIAGASVVFPQIERHDLVGLVDIVADMGVTSMTVVASILQTMVATDLLARDDLALRVLVSAGEAAPLGLFKDLHRVLPDTLLANCYGPAECCIEVTGHVYDPKADLPHMVLGQPSDNVTLSVVDAAGRSVPFGHVGEIAISGAQVGLGYHNAPDKTAPAFVADTQGDLLYRTGDIGRMGLHGLAYLGRRDHQMKVRGQRIEAGEIEALANQCKAVQSSVAFVIDANLLVAVESGDDCAEAVMDMMRHRAPVVPQRIVVLDSFPRGSSSKIDRKALMRLIEEMPVADPRTSVTPVTPLERVVLDEAADVLTRALGSAPVLRPEQGFFDVGGNSLTVVSLAVRLQERLAVPVAVADIFGEASFAAIADVMLAKGANVRDVRPEALCVQVQPQETVLHAPATSAQRALWFLAQMEGGTAAYTTINAFKADDRLDIAALRRACDQLLARHMPLRTRFAQDGDAVVQVIDPPAGFPFRHDTTAINEDAIEGVIRAELVRGFDLAQDWPVRLRIVPLDTGYLCVLALHHIATDGWSNGVMLDDLAALYADAEALAWPSETFAEIANTQHETLNSDQAERQRADMVAALQDAPQRIALPYDKDRPARQTFEGATHVIKVPRELALEVETFAKATSTSVFIIGLTAFMAALHRWSLQDDLLVGVPVANRQTTHAQSLIGLFANSMVLRGALSSDMTFAQLLDQIRARTIVALDNQSMPFEHLVDGLNVARDTAVAPVFQVMFNHQNTPARQPRLGDVSLTSVPFETATAKYDILATLLDQPDGTIDLHWEFSTDVFTPDTAARMADQFVGILRAGLTDPDQTVAALPVAGAAAQLIGDVTADAEFVHDMIIPHVEQTPDAAAAQMGDATLSYAELAEWSDAIAGRLNAAGIGPGDRVGVSLQRGFGLIASLVGVFKSGAAFVALDHSLPVARQELIAQEAQLAACLTDGQADWTPDCPVISHQQAPHSKPIAPVQRDPSDPAYLLFTSGSTGTPKGVVYPHRGLANLIAFQLQEPYFLHKARCLQFTAIGFDVAIQEIFATLASGGTLILINDQQRQDVPELLAHLQDTQVAQMFVPFAALQQLAVAHCMAPQDLALKTIITAGERLHITADVRAFFAATGARLVNQYGPTETHVVSRAILNDDPKTWPEFPSIGTAVHNSEIMVRAADGQPCPIGVPGEICVTGAPVALGYYNAPEATVEVFGDRGYRTGDLGVIWPDANGLLELRYLGRRDQQIKLRGYRVNVTEVENALCNLPDVAECVVVPLADQTGTTTALVAHLVGTASLDSDHLRNALRLTLPDYMVPAYWMQHDALPRAATGKLLRTGLPAPTDADFAASTRTRVTADGARETQIMEIWQKLLGRDDLSTTDNFFDVGGSSIILLELHAQLQDVGQTTFKVVQLFEHPTIKSQAQLIGGETTTKVTTRSAGRVAAQKNRRRRSRTDSSL
jgi:amino acid adenylation domain-containing protein